MLIQLKIFIERNAKNRQTNDEECEMPTVPLIGKTHENAGHLKKRLMVSRASTACKSPSRGEHAVIYDEMHNIVEEHNKKVLDGLSVDRFQYCSIVLRRSLVSFFLKFRSFQ